MKKYVVEGFGTAVLVLVGCGSAVLAGELLGLLGIALAFGLAVSAMVYTIGSISGCHINPAITCAMWMRGKISLQDSVFYVIAQMIGAVLGAWLVTLLAGESVSVASNQLASGVPLATGILAEVLATMMFLLVIFGVTSKDGAGHLSGLIIGLTLSMNIILIGTLTNAALNPARAFGPALLEGGVALSQLWIFVVGPLLGALLAVAVWRYLFAMKD